MRRISIVPLLIAIALVASCSSTSPEPTYYLLRGEPAEGASRVKADVRIGLGRIVIAPYLLVSPGLVVETSPGEVRPARLHQWAEPLDSGVRWFLRSEISRALGHDFAGGLTDLSGWDYTIDVYIGRLHGTMSGSALLEAAYVIRPKAGSSAPADYRFSKSLRLEDEGYAALAAADQRLLAELARSIAGSLQEMRAVPELQPAGGME